MVASAGMILSILAIASTPSSILERCRVRPCTVSSASSDPACMVSAELSVGSPTTNRSARTPCCSMCTVPTPPCSSPTTWARITSPRSRIPARCTARSPAT